MPASRRWGRRAARPASSRAGQRRRGRAPASLLGLSSRVARCSRARTSSHPRRDTARRHGSAAAVRARRRRRTAGTSAPARRACRGAAVPPRSRAAEASGTSVAPSSTVWVSVWFPMRCPASRARSTSARRRGSRRSRPQTKKLARSSRAASVSRTPGVTSSKGPLSKLSVSRLPDALTTPRPRCAARCWACVASLPGPSRRRRGGAGVPGGRALRSSSISTNPAADWPEHRPNGRLRRSGLVGLQGAASVPRGHGRNGKRFPAESGMASAGRSCMRKAALLALVLATPARSAARSPSRAAGGRAPCARWWQRPTAPCWRRTAARSSGSTLLRA